MADEQVQIDWSQLPTLSAHWQASESSDALQQALGIDMSQEQSGDQSVQIDWGQLPTLAAHWEVQGDDNGLAQKLGIDAAEHVS